MSYEKDVATTICEKYRMDALGVFISRTIKALSDALFATRSSNLPSALALAQGLESNHERYLFASIVIILGPFKTKFRERNQKTAGEILER